jgi:hypothetical protein
MREPTSLSSDPLSESEEEKNEKIRNQEEEF